MTSTVPTCSDYKVDISQLKQMERICQNLLIEKAIQTIQEIQTDTQYRLDHWKNDITLLKSGIYYAYRYFKTLGEVKNDSTLAQETRKLADDRLTWFINNDKFYHGIAPNYFRMESCPESLTQMKRNIYVLEKDKLPSDALKALREGITFLGCGEVCLVSYYEALKKVLGEDKFDAIFASNATPLRISADLQPLIRILQQREIKSLDDLKKGDLVYIYGAAVEGIRPYRSKHRWGDMCGYNLICVDDTPKQQKFTTVGYGLDPKGNTYEKILKDLSDGYNETPLVMEDIVSAELGKKIKEVHGESIDKGTKLINDSGLDQIPYEVFQELGGGEVNSYVYQFDFEKVARLKFLSIQDAVKYFNLLEPLTFR